MSSTQEPHTSFDLKQEITEDAEVVWIQMTCLPTILSFEFLFGVLNKLGLQDHLKDKKKIAGRIDTAYLLYGWGREEK